MIGHRVRLITVQSWSVEGTLQALDQAGATIATDRGNVFIPMHRIVEIVDLGRAP